jgi:hypothetical protein
VICNRIVNEYSHLLATFERRITPIDVCEMKKVASFILDKFKSMTFINIMHCWRVLE